MKVIVASKNPAKIASAEMGFKAMFPSETIEFIGIAAPSGVADQPMTEQETILGAENRLRYIRTEHPDADYWIAFEGGIEEKEDGMSAFAWALVADKNNKHGKGSSGVFYLPPKIAELIKSGVELGHANDQVFGLTNSKHSMGGIGILTDGAIDRKHLYADAAIRALIPFKNPELY